MSYIVCHAELVVDVVIQYLVLAEYFLSEIGGCVFGLRISGEAAAVT